MKLATWNVNSLVARMPRVLDPPDHHPPAVLVIQVKNPEPAAVPLLVPEPSR
jgi:hypothetical protein